MHNQIQSNTLIIYTKALYKRESDNKSVGIFKSVSLTCSIRQFMLNIRNSLCVNEIFDI